MSVQLYFRGEKLAKVMGSLAMQKPQEGVKVRLYRFWVDRKLTLSPLPVFRLQQVGKLTFLYLYFKYKIKLLLLRMNSHFQSWALLFEVTCDLSSSTWGNKWPEIFYLRSHFTKGSPPWGHILSELLLEVTYGLSSSSWVHIWPELFSLRSHVTWALLLSSWGHM